MGTSRPEEILKEIDVNFKKYCASLPDFNTEVKLSDHQYKIIVQAAKAGATQEQIKKAFTYYPNPAKKLLFRLFLDTQYNDDRPIQELAAKITNEMSLAELSHEIKMRNWQLKEYWRDNANSKVDALQTEKNKLQETYVRKIANSDLATKTKEIASLPFGTFCHLVHIDTRWDPTLFGQPKEMESKPQTQAIMAKSF